MPIFCIPPDLLKKLKESALKGEVDIQKLIDMKSSGDRRAFFEKYTNKELGKFLNTKFEEAMVSKKKSAYLDFVKSVYTPTGKQKQVYKSLVDKINLIDESILNPKGEQAFLEDFVSSKLGLDVTKEQVAVISEKAAKIQALQEKVEGEIGNVAKEAEVTEFLKAKSEMDEYLQSQMPASNLKVLTGTYGRGMMLSAPKSSILNIGSNLQVGITESIIRRLSERAWKGTDNKLALDYVKMVQRIYQKTGYDISRMTTLEDTGTKGGRVLGETVHAQGPGAIRKAGRIVEDIVFKQMLGAPDVAFSAANFADSVNINAMKMAKNNPVKARELMAEAMKLDATGDGAILRQQAILDAQKATWTGHTIVSKFSEGVRKVFNDASGDFRAGDWLFPFVKTPANVIATGMDYAGMGIPKVLFDTVKSMREGDMGSPEHIRAVSRTLSTAGFGLTAAFIIASQLDDDDFVGAYDPKRAQIESLRNSNTNAFRVGDKWISTEWLAALGIPVSAIMYARKYGKAGKGEMAYQYVSGVLSGIKSAPVIKEIMDWSKNNTYKQNQTLSEMTGQTANYTIDQLSARLMPSSISDIAKMTDKYQRTSTKGVEAFKAKVPGLRQTLPIKTDIFGKQLENEPAWSTILFGSRVKSDKESAIIKEINTVSQNADKSINFTDWDKSSSKTLAQFKEKKGQAKFDEAKLRYGKELQAKLEKVIKNSSYNRLSDEEKAKVINGFDTEVMNSVFKRYGFKYKPAKSPKLPKF
jgi:hypothetical protein